MRCVGTRKAKANDIDREVDVRLFWRAHRKHVVPAPHRKPQKAGSAHRICRFEQMEARQLLSATIAPIHVATTYFEDSNEVDQPGVIVGTSTPVADVFQVSFTGGADGSELKSLTIDLKNTFFNTENASPGVYGYFPLAIISHTGFEVTSSSIVNGGTQLVLKFSGFGASDRLVFSVDVDENGNEEPNAVVEGAELEGATMTAAFTAAHMQDLTLSGAVFWDKFAKHYSTFAATDLASLLPNEDYDNQPALDFMPSQCSPGYVYTALAYATDTQTPLPITLSGTVYDDPNINNIHETGEPGIAGVQLSLLELVNGSYTATGKTTTTDANGDYEFTGLLPGTYRVVESQPSGYLSVGSTPGTVNGATRGSSTSEDILSSINLEGGDDSIHNDFAEVKPASISGYVYVDTDNDGVYDSSESPIANVTVALLDADGNATGKTATTNTSGYYSFTGLMPDTYGVEETQPAGYIDGLDTAGTVNGTAKGVAQSTLDRIDGVALGDDESGVNYNFGELLPASISGYVYVDADNDGVRDSGESPIGNVAVALLDSSGNATGKTTTTDDTGFYRFDNLAPGIYGVKETQPSGYLDGLDTAGTIGGATKGTAHNPGDLIDVISLGSGESGINYNFGELLPASISGYAYVDANNNGVYDSGETPIANVTLTLLDSSGKSTGKTATTNDQGYYSFKDLLPGTYGVKETQPSGYFDGLDAAGTIGGTIKGTAHNPGDLIDAVPLVSGDTGVHYDFGELQPASISGRVYADLNNTATFDSTDTPLAGVTVKLYQHGCETIVATAVTDANGKYSFTNLAPGTYCVVEIQPAGYLEGGDQVGTVNGVASGTLDGSNRICSAQLDSGDNGINYDFWEVVPAKISGYVFQDGPAIVIQEGDPQPDIPSVRDGKLTSDDKRLSGIVMKLCDGSGYPLTANGKQITTTTDANGYYEFTMLLPGDYSVIEAQPTGYVPGIDTAGSNGGLVVNKYTKVDANTLRSLAVDASGSAIVRIKINPGDASVRNNFSEVLIVQQPDDNPPYIPPPTPTPITPQPPPLPYTSFQPAGIIYSFVPDVVRQPVAGGGSGPSGYTWHLSVIDAGQPRQENSGNEYVQAPQNTVFDPVSWSGAELDQSRWILADKDGNPIQTLTFGMSSAIPVTGDWLGTGVTRVGVFLDGLWFLDLNGNGVWDKDDLWVKLGVKGDKPVSGDWNGDGKTDVGIFGPAWVGDVRAITVEPGLPDALNPPVQARPKNVPPDPADAAVGWRSLKKGHNGRMRSDVIDHVFQYGVKGDIPVVGDWNGDGIFTVGIFRNGTWFLDMDGDGRWSKGDIAIEYGQDGDLPVVGDWTGDGISKLGIYRDGKFYLDTNNNHQIDATDKVFALGRPGDRPVSGDWNGDGVDEVGVYEDGAATAVPLQASRK
jgi:serine-aspartate repeat-containing protein C/D/E